MALDLNAIGSPSGGLFLFGKKLSLPRDEGGPLASDRLEPASSGPRLSGEVPLNPYAEALRTAARLERDRRVVGLLEPPVPRRTLGSHIDLRA